MTIKPTHRASDPGHGDGPARPKPDVLKLREEVERVVREELTRLGVNGFKAAKVVRRFQGQIGAATLNRWISDVMPRSIPIVSRQDVSCQGSARNDHKRPSATMADDVDVAAIARTLDYCRFFAGAAERSLMDAEECLEACRDADGNPRDIPQFLAASEARRRGLETFVRVSEILRDITELKEANAMIIEEIGKESDPCARRILKRLDEMLTRLGHHGALP